MHDNDYHTNKAPYSKPSYVKKAFQLKRLLGSKQPSPGNGE
jgi:hypothetical protein